MSIGFQAHSLRRDLGNFALLRHRRCRGFLASMHQSGTHWLKHMLATAMARRYGIPPPAHADANEIIGGFYDPLPPENVPRLLSSHSIPHPLVAAGWLHGLLDFPPYVVLVRDIRATLVANYEKWKTHYGCNFQDYLKGDASGRRFNHDIWWCIRFCNAWGKLREHLPGAVLVVRYEDLQRDPFAVLGNVNRFLQLDLSDGDLAAGIRASGKEQLQAKSDPAAPFGLQVVRTDDRPFEKWYGDNDREFVAGVLGRHLHCDFRYDYTRWDEAASSS